MKTTTTEKLFAPFQWCDRQFATQRDCEKAIADSIAEQLCIADAGSVEVGATPESEGETTNISVRVDILTPEGEKSARLIDAAPALLEAAKAALELLTHPTAKIGYGSGDWQGHTTDRLRAIIAKAGGAT